ncbi:MAG TPA: response regulator transcription factor [Rickettsiales bacterium]|nr:response regulator transcription factor [Rickettsiales bacterium]
MKKFKILVVDDDTRIRELLQQILVKNGFTTSVSANGNEAREELKKSKFDLIVLDLMMPDESGIELLKDLRINENLNIPAIMLTAMGDIDNKVECFENGCNDYLVKPFESKELILRINNLLKKNKPRKEFCKFGDFVFDFNKQMLTKDKENIYLTDIETKLLNLFCENINEPLSREDLLIDELNERSIDVSVARLRKKIETNSRNPRYLRTVRYKGYILNN